MNIKTVEWYRCPLCNDNGFVYSGETPDAYAWGIPTVNHENQDDPHEWEYFETRNTDIDEWDNSYIG